MEGDLNLSEYPIWFGKDDQIYCNSNELKGHIADVLNYSQADASRLTLEVIELLKRDINDKQEVPHSKLTKTDISTELFKVILKCVHPVKKTKLLCNTQQYDKWSGETCNAGSAFHFYIKWERNDIVDLIIQSLTNEELFMLLGTTDLKRQTPVHYACRATAAEALRKMRERLNDNQWYQLLLMGSTTPLHNAARKGNTEAVKLIHESVTACQWYILLRKKDILNDTPLHLATDGCHIETVKIIQSSITADQWFQLLKTQGETDATPLQYAALSGHKTIVKLIESSVTTYQWYKLLKMDDEWSYTPLQAAAYEGHTEVLNAVQESVDIDVWIDLLRYGRLGYRGISSRYAKKNKCLRGEKLLLDKHAEALVNKVIRIETISGQHNRIHELVKNEPLTSVHIEKLSPLSSYYIIPHKQWRCKRYGLILFSSAQRQGAEQEADCLSQALKAAGCEISKLHWSNAGELHNLIESALRGMDDCALLIVCLMSHGSRGVIKGNFGRGIPVNEILHQFSFTLPQGIPLVLLIQACQVADLASIPASSVTQSDPAPTQLSDPLRDQHITLTRPHTVLLLATVRGGVAYRGVFTGAMADEFRTADGKKDIYKMYNRAVAAMKRNNLDCVSQQHPEIRGVTEKMLVLPPATSH